MKAQLQDKKVILYRRVSTTDQKESGNSLNTQHNSLRDFARKNGMNVVNEYEEDYSAKNFNRPEFKKLQDFVKKSKGKVDYILITSWDRFSRNAHDALGVIHNMRELGVEVNCIENWIDHDDPQQLIMMLLYLGIPEVDNRVRSQKVRTCMRQGLKEGRWNVGQPIGYIPGKDPENPNKILMKVDPEKGPSMAELFKEFARGIYSQNELRALPRFRHLNLSRSNLNVQLRNVLYAGKIRVPAYKDEPEELKDALHESLITWETYEKVQYQLAKRRKVKSKTSKFNDLLPLRGHLMCPDCGGNLTGSGSTSETGKRHYYYHCNTSKGCKVRFRVEDVHIGFEHLINDLKPDPQVIELFKLIMKDHYQNAEKTKYAAIEILKKKVKTLEKRQENLLNNMLDKIVTSVVYKKHTDTLDKEILELNIQLRELGDFDNDLHEYINFGSFLLENLGSLYQKANVQIKNKVLSSILEDKLIFTGKNYRTPKFKEAVSHIYLNIKDLERKNAKKGAASKNISFRVPRTRFELARP